MSTAAKEVRIAAVGCGRHATSRVFPCFAKLPVRLVGVCDLDPALAAANARRFAGESSFSDAATMLDQVRPDGLVVCAGPEAHVALALLALQRGIAVYTEKPAAPSAADAWKVAQAARAAGKLVMTGFKYRYGRAMDKVKAIMATPAFGKVVAINVLRCSGWMDNLPGQSRSQFLLDFCCHPIDMVCYVGGEVDEVYAIAHGQDSYAITLRFASGAVGTMMFSSRASWARPVDRTEILGERGHVITIDDQIFMRYHVDGAQKDGHDPKFCTAGSDSMEETGFIGEMRAFVEHLAGTRTIDSVPSRVDESVKSLALYEAILASLASGKPERPARFAASRSSGA
ncbi:MAG: Gfo/Idh/MocA family oxidoreductase [Planctomycetes bacterium]|nr:Gfo/Idh/MocA family oxidoreductase [Planctomycetota bacterium]